MVDDCHAVMRAAAEGNGRNKAVTCSNTYEVLTEDWGKRSCGRGREGDGKTCQQK